jgi:hypothetical protein
MLVSISETERESIFSLLKDSQKKTLEKSFHSMIDGYFSELGNLMSSLGIKRSPEDSSKIFIELNKLCQDSFRTYYGVRRKE